MNEFFRVEEYLWKAMLKQPTGSELREWYLGGWWVLVYTRPPEWSKHGS